MAIAYAIGYFAASVWVCLPFIYWFTAPEFYKTFTGRTLMMLLASTGGMFLLLILGGFLGDYPGREYVMGAVFLGVLLAGFRTAILFFKLRFGSQNVADKTLTTSEKGTQYGSQPNTPR